VRLPLGVHYPGHSSAVQSGAPARPSTAACSMCAIRIRSRSVSMKRRDPPHWRRRVWVANNVMESFAGMLLRYRGRTALAQRQLALRVGVSRRSIQDWESGVSCPDAQHLRALITVLFVSGSMANAHDATNAEALWAAAMRQSPRMRSAPTPRWRRSDGRTAVAAITESGVFSVACNAATSSSQRTTRSRKSSSEPRVLLPYRRYRLPMPTPARWAMAETGAEAPWAAKTSRAAFRTRRSLRAPSA
jgi:ribosome-binding protein aMBF1 (putative translation factor)